jgi:hypothetical protein
MSFPAFSYAQSLGDVARQSRAEEHNSGAPHPKVITNEDIADSAPAREGGGVKDPPPRNSVTKNEAAGTQSSVSAGEPESKDILRPPKTGSSKRPEITAEEEAQERETQQHTDEINKYYLDRIAALRDQINSAQLDLASLQGDFENRWNMWERYPPADVHFRELQALGFNQHVSELIEAQRGLIAGMESELQDVQEAARHAGVPHATD